MRSAQRSALMFTALCFLTARSAAAAETDSTATAPPASTAAASAPADADVIGRLDALTEQMQTLQSDTDKLKRFKFSGYLQVRYEKSEASNDSVQVASKASAYALNTITPANQDRFYIRRGRFKLTYDSGPLSQALLYFDGGTDRTLRLLEATVTLLDPWTVLHVHALTVGQMNVPFGYEIERSSSVRELPERSRAENVLFPGERDRGVKLVDHWTPKLETVIGVFNGGGINHPSFPNTDPTRAKDVVGRVRWTGGTVDLGASYYAGRELTPLTGPDVVTDKTRFGADAEVYYAAQSLGGGSLKGEFYSGHNQNADSLKALVVPGTAANGPTLLAAGADPAHLATDFRGAYVMWVQNLGDPLQFAARWDAFDPNVDLAHDQFQRVSLGLNYFYDGNTRLTVAYDAVRTDKPAANGYTDPKDNLWTLQVQHKF
jgi:hypothetical protein